MDKIVVVKNNTRPLHIGAIPLLLLALGLIFVGASFLHNLGSHLRLLGLKVKEPPSFNFTSYDLLLKKYVRNGLVNYESLKKDPSLAFCTDELAGTSPDKLKNKQEELIYWLNAYNFLSLKNIAEHYPIKEYKELGHSPRSHKFIVGGKLLSLADIEENCLNPLIDKTDWRAIFLVSDGCIGNPELASHAYDSEKFAADLETACSNFVCKPSNYILRPEKRIISVSPFYLQNERFIKKEYASPSELICQELGKKLNLNRRDTEWNYALPFDYRINDSALFNQSAERKRE